MAENVSDNSIPARPAPVPGAPSHAERLQLVDALQKIALSHTDPLQANLDMIAGDLLRLLHHSWQGLAQELSRSGAPAAPSARQVEQYLRISKEVSRITLAGRRHCRHPRREADAV